MVYPAQEYEHCQPQQSLHTYQVTHLFDKHNNEAYPLREFSGQLIKGYALGHRVNDAMKI
jgi:hypothetical protein